MPCYVTYKIRTVIKEEDIELFKTIAKEQRLSYTLDREFDQVTGKYIYTVITRENSGISGTMEELTAQKMVKEAKKRNWKVKEVKAKVKA